MPESPFDLSGKTILVTGASSGIGRATAIVLSKLGATVVLAGRREDALRDTLSSISGEGHLIEPFDLSDTDAIPAWVGRICAQTKKPLNGMVHAAGISITVPLRVQSRKHLDEVMVANVYSSFALLRAFSSKLNAAEGASLVLLSSISSLAGCTGFTAYAASKGALNSLILSASRELAPRKIRVNCLAPTYVTGTPMMDRQVDEVPGESVQKFQSDSFLGFPTAQEVAGSAAFLLSDAARTITGVTLPIDGGFLC